MSAYCPSAIDQEILKRHVSFKTQRAERSDKYGWACYRFPYRYYFAQAVSQYFPPDKPVRKSKTRRK